VLRVDLLLDIAAAPDLPLLHLLPFFLRYYCGFRTLLQMYHGFCFFPSSHSAPLYSLSMCVH
jgi:hypothetical protein